MSEGFACQGALWRLRVPLSCAGTHPFLSPNPFFLDRSSENPLLASTHRSAGRPTTPLALTFRRIRHEPPWRYIPSSSDLTLDQLPPLLPRSARSALSSCCAGEAGLPKHGNVVRYFCLPQTKCHDGVGDGRETEEGRTCARGTGGFGKRESESERPLANKVSGHSVGRGGRGAKHAHPAPFPATSVPIRPRGLVSKVVAETREFCCWSCWPPAVFAVALLPRPPDREKERERVVRV